MPQDEPRPDAEPPTDELASATPDPRDRRKSDRREKSAAAEGKERRAADRRKDVDVPDEYRARQRSINEYPLKPDELEFINAINAYKQAYNKPFPTWSEVLHILRALGYRKSAAAAKPTGAED